MLNEGPEERHPSFGLISVARWQSTRIPLFESPFTHQHGIQIEVKSAYRRRSHLHDNFLGVDKTVLSLMMSEAQFAQFITSPNVGMGTPCTLTYVEGERVKLPSQDQTKQTFQKEAVEEFQNLSKRAEELEKLVDTLTKKGHLNAAERTLLRDATFELTRSLNDHIPYFFKRFEETMDKVVQQAKTEVEAHVNAVIAKKGLEALVQKGDLPKIEG